jgi:anaerobic dimethyl sulfoxide reductase subunit C (anchor subunit)
MNPREVALVVFTIFAQMSVGSFVVLGIVHFFAIRKAGMEEADQLSDRALLAIVLVLGMGLLASLGHLGNPLNAPRAVTHLGSSWLSREVFFGVTFVVVGGVFALMQWFKIASFAVRNSIAWLAAAIGLALVYSMSRIYMQRTVPVWDTLATPTLFFTTTFLLGGLAIGVAFVTNYIYLKRRESGYADTQRTLLHGALRWIAVSSIALLGVEFIVIPLYVAYLSAQGGRAAVSAAMMFGRYAPLFGVRLGLVFFGAGVLAVFLYQHARSLGREKIMGNLTYAAFGLVFAGEILGRVLFYSTYLRVGM